MNFSLYYLINIKEIVLKNKIEKKMRIKKKLNFNHNMTILKIK